ncbi:MAG: putative Ca2+/H+ antiporter (TMEM165/GDT1 family) [Rhodoferax sp.]
MAGRPWCQRFQLGKTFDCAAFAVAGEAHGHCFCPARETLMEAFFISTGVVALAEIGDKTQLLAFILAARFKKPIPIIAGILFATLLNHGLAGALGAWITSVVSVESMRWALGLSFIGMAIWTLIPDKIEEEETYVAKHLGVFGATFVTFFLAEMGDKTQIATVALAAHYAAPLLVIAGTTLGMLIADIPAVFIGDKFAAKISIKLVHCIAAGIFVLMGVLTLFQVEKLFQ